MQIKIKLSGEFDTPQNKLSIIANAVAIKTLKTLKNNSDHNDNISVEVTIHDKSNKVVVNAKDE